MTYSTDLAEIVPSGDVDQNEYQPGADGTESGEAEMNDPEARRGDDDGEDGPRPAAATDDGSDDKRRSAFSRVATPIKDFQLETIQCD